MLCKRLNCNRIAHYDMCIKCMLKPKPITNTGYYFSYHKLYKTVKWTKLRNRKLSLNPLCEDCGVPGKDIDHIVPHKGDVLLFYELTNLQTLCRSCHSRKTIMENKTKHLTKKLDVELFIDTEFSEFEKMKDKLEFTKITDEIYNTVIRGHLNKLGKNMNGKINLYSNSLKSCIIYIYQMRYAMKGRFKKIHCTNKTWEHILNKE